MVRVRVAVVAMPFFNSLASSVSSVISLSVSLTLYSFQPANVFPSGASPAVKITSVPAATGAFSSSTSLSSFAAALSVVTVYSGRT